MKNAQVTAISSVEDVKRTRIFERVNSEFQRAKASGHRFVTIESNYDEDFAVFVQAVIRAANESNPPPHGMAPYFGQTRGRDLHSTSTGCGMIVTF